MTTIMNIMRISLTVLAIDPDGYSATVKYGMGEPGTKGYEENILEDVYITGLLKHRFKNNEKFVVGKEYVCENNSKDYNKCPIKLVRTANGKGELMFCLLVVNEGKTHTTKLHTPSGKEIESRTFTTIPSSKWMRYSDYYDRNRKVYLERLEAKQQTQSN